MPHNFRVFREEGVRPHSWFYHINDGFYYHKSDTKGLSTYLKCVSAYKGCRGRAMYDNVEGFVHTQIHNHDPDPYYAEEMALRRNILNRCRSLDYSSYTSIVNEESRHFPPAVASRVSLAKMRTSMRNARLTNYPYIPQTLEDLTRILIDPQYAVLTMTEDGADNLYAGSVTDSSGNHHVMFSSQRMIKRMKDFRVLHSDGTFKSVPAGPEFADQVFCVVGAWSHHIIPLAWVLMSSRTEPAYVAVLRLLKQLLGQRIEVTKAITDFETAEANAWQRVFGVSVQGCLWHFARACLTKVSKLHLLVHMRNIESVRKVVRLTIALCLLPENLITQGYAQIVRYSLQEGRYVFRLVRPYLHYVWRYWVGRPWRRRRMCVYASLQRTNNVCEGNNFQLRTEVGTHSNIYKFIHGLIALEQRTHNAIIALEQGRRVTRSRKRSSILNDERIRNLGDELLNPPGPIRQAIFRFLRAASHTMDNMVHELIDGRRYEGRE